MEVLVVAGAGLAIAAAVNAAQKNNPDRQLAQQEKAACEALKKAQSKRNPNPAEIAQLEQNAKAITIERMRQTMERSEHKMVKYRQEGQIAKAEKHSKRAASLKAELQRTAPYVLNQQYQQQPYPSGAVMAAIPIANGAHSPQPHAGEKGTYVQWPPSQQSANQQGPYTLGDYMGAPNTSTQPQSQHNYQNNQNQSSYPQPNYQFNQQYSNQHHPAQPVHSQHASNMPEAREVLRTPAVSPLPQFQGSQSSQAASSLGGFSYEAPRPQHNAYSSNNFPVAAPAAAHKSSSGPRATLPEAREVLRPSDAQPLAQFQQGNATNGVVHIDLTNGPRSDVPPPSYTPREAEYGHSAGQQAYQNVGQSNPPPAYNPSDWSVPSKK